MPAFRIDDFELYDPADSTKRAVFNLSGFPSGSTRVSAPVILKQHINQTIGSPSYADISDLVFPLSTNTDYAFMFHIVFRSASVLTGCRFSMNGPAGATIAYQIKQQTILNTTTVLDAAWLEGHTTSYDTMNVQTTTVSAGVDLLCTMAGRILVAGTSGNLAARSASSATNSDIVVQQGSWGMVF